ncbi:succinate dehydrogenase cytochrome b560 subunit, mitochondrial-like [Watersipora subatra]|uniref:succinate dehydrogenase cytochrome b560 subunit, mitochondrial-like n=1 Tax=Watersipora subatra TaxID=2589382 RepID=UPI00355AF897
MALSRVIKSHCLRQTLLGRHAFARFPIPATSCVQSSTDTVGKARTDMHGHWVKNETMKRPISPHLTITRWDLPMATSLLHRITGSVLTGTLYVFAYTICVLPGDYVTYLNVIKDMNMGPVLITSFKFILSFPLAYHALNAARHLGWDTGAGFSLPAIHRTGWFAVVGAAVLAALMTQL